VEILGVLLVSSQAGDGAAADPLCRDTLDVSAFRSLRVICFGAYPPARRRLNPIGSGFLALGYKSVFVTSLRFNPTLNDPHELALICRLLT